MARERIAADGHSAGSAHRFSSLATETLAGNRTITLTEIEAYNIFSFDPGGAGRTITLPAEADCAGVMIFIANRADAAEILTINNDAAGTIATPTQNESALLVCDGVGWYAAVGDDA